MGYSEFLSNVYPTDTLTGICLASLQAKILHMWGPWDITSGEKFNRGDPGPKVCCLIVVGASNDCLRMQIALNILIAKQACRQTAVEMHMIFFGLSTILSVGLISL